MGNKYVYCANNPVMYSDPSGNRIDPRQTAVDCDPVPDPGGGGEPSGNGSTGGETANTGTEGDDVGEGGKPNLPPLPEERGSGQADTGTNDGPTPDAVDFEEETCPTDLSGMDELDIDIQFESTSPSPSDIDFTIAEFSKTRHTQGDSGLRGIPDEEISKRARDKTLSGKERNRYQKEEKLRGERNKQKRKNHYNKIDAIYFLDEPISYKYDGRNHGELSTTVETADIMELLIAGEIVIGLAMGLYICFSNDIGFARG